MENSLPTQPVLVKNLLEAAPGQKTQLNMEELQQLAKTATQGSTTQVVPKNRYLRQIKPNVWVDVYDVLLAFQVSCPATQHAIKKLLMPGSRGSKDKIQDLIEAHQSIARAINIATT